MGQKCMQNSSRLEFSELIETQISPVKSRLIASSLGQLARFMQSFCQKNK